MHKKLTYYYIYFVSQKPFLLAENNYTVDKFEFNFLN